MDDIRKGDVVTGWFGKGIVTDVASGFLTDQITGDRLTEDDDMVRIQQRDKANDVVYTYIYRSDIKRNLSAEDGILRA